MAAGHARCASASGRSSTPRAPACSRPGFTTPRSTTSPGAILALLFAFTGSLLIPLKTIVTTALSIGAALGITTWIYQDGHLAATLGTQGVGALNIVTVPLVAAIAFGLAMDYEVFILGRIRETWLEGRDTAASVTAGLQRSGRIVTSAALLIALVFCCFIIGSNAVIGQIGLGLTLAVLIDASLVRMLLVPATMALLGRAAWWAPAPLGRLHARFGLREEPVSVGAVTAATASATTEAVSAQAQAQAKAQA